MTDQPVTYALTGLTDDSDESSREIIETFETYALAEHAADWTMSHSDLQVWTSRLPLNPATLPIDC